MANNEEEVGVRITATADDLTAGTEKAKEGIEGIANSAAELKETLTTVAEAMGAMWAIDKLEEFVEKMAELGEQVEHTAAMTGLSVEQVQDFQYAVEATGGTTQNANLALVQLERHIAEAAQGVGQATDAFTRLGVSQKELQSGDVTAIMKTMADTMHNTADGANKVEAMYRAVGRSGAQLIPIFDLGSKAVDEMNKKFAETGAQMSEGMAQQLTLMAQQMYLAESASTGVSVAMSGQLLPSINAVLAGWTRYQEGISRAINSTTGLGEVVHFLGAVLDGSVAFVMALATGFEQLADIAVGAGNAIITEWNTVGQVMEDFWNMKFKKMMTDASAGFSAAGNQMMQGFKDANTAGQEYLQTLQKMMDAYNGASVGIGLGRGDQNNPFKPPAQQGGGNDINAKKALYQQNYDNKKETDQLMVESGQMSNQQMMADLQQALETEKSEIMSAYTQELATANLTTQKKKQLLEEEAAEVQKINNQELALTIQAAKQQEKTWQQAYKTMSTYMDAFVLDELRGDQKMGQQFQQMTQKMVAQFVSAVAMMTLKWLAFQALQASGFAQTAQSVAGMGGGGGQNSLMSTLATNILSLVGITTTQEVTTTALSAAVTANTAALAANTAARAASGGGSSSIFGAAGDMLGFASGADYVPNNMVAQIHKGEMIIPAGPADAIRQGAASQGGYGGSQDTHVHFHTASLDSHTAAKMWTRNSAGIAKAVKSASRGNTAGLKSSFARM